eukprot:7382293-Prymnesium_polylepis.1
MLVGRGSEGATGRAKEHAVSNISVAGVDAAAAQDQGLRSGSEPAYESCGCIEDDGAGLWRLALPAEQRASAACGGDEVGGAAGNAHAAGAEDQGGPRYRRKAVPASAIKAANELMSIERRAGWWTEGAGCQAAGGD